MQLQRKYLRYSIIIYLYISVYLICISFWTCVHCKKKGDWLEKVNWKVAGVSPNSSVFEQDTDPQTAPGEQVGAVSLFRWCESVNGWMGNQLWSTLKARKIGKVGYKMQSIYYLVRIWKADGACLTLSLSLSLTLSVCLSSTGKCSKQKKTDVEKERRAIKACEVHVDYGMVFMCKI